MKLPECALAFLRPNCWRRRIRKTRSKAGPSSESDDEEDEDEDEEDSAMMPLPSESSLRPAIVRGRDSRGCVAPIRPGASARTESGADAGAFVLGIFPLVCKVPVERDDDKEEPSVAVEAFAFLFFGILKPGKGEGRGGAED